MKRSGERREERGNTHLGRGESRAESGWLARSLAVIRFPDSQISISPLLSVHLASSPSRAPAPAGRPADRPSSFSATFPNLKAQVPRQPPPPPPPRRRLGIGLLEPLNTRTQLGERGTMSPLDSGPFPWMAFAFVKVQSGLAGSLSKRDHSGR